MSDVGPDEKGLVTGGQAEKANDQKSSCSNAGWYFFIL